MKFIFALFVLGAVYAAEAYEYNTEGLAIEKLLEDAVALEAFVDCFLDKADCSDQVAAFKNDMPEVIETSCSKCNDNQKTMFKLFLNGLKEKLPTKFEEYRNKYDSGNKYFDAFLASVADH